ncbi:MAG TPA: Lrp/AsnC family transcriptional regulator [Acetobacteraceae bacterium]|nr:Lrp/AsnC family transcriptional regulator [Acetobacteraceae bacterium]
MPSRPDLDSIDRRLLALLQQDATPSVAQLAERVNLSQNACWRRIKLMEEAGVIARRVALLDPAKLGVGLTVFVSFKLTEHAPEALERFARLVRDMPEAVEFHRITGEFDYLLKLQLADITAYDAVYKRLIQSVRLADVRACFAMEVLKQTTALPLEP